MMFCIRKYPLWCMFCLTLDFQHISYQPASCSSGAIHRLAVERETTSSMTYANFVTDLDTGDSFTTTLLDILVKVGFYNALLNIQIIWSLSKMSTGNRRQALK